VFDIDSDVKLKLKCKQQNLNPQQKLTHNADFASAWF